MAAAAAETVCTRSGSISPGGVEELDVRVSRFEQDRNKDAFNVWFAERSRPRKRCAQAWGTVEPLRERGCYKARFEFYEAKVELLDDAVHGNEAEQIEQLVVFQEVIYMMVVYENKALNVTEFLPEHPGGELATPSFAGKDATKALCDSSKGGGVAGYRWCESVASPRRQPSLRS